MAAALVPIIAGLAPEIINLIAGLVHRAAPTAEINNGPATGPVKFAEVFGAVMQALQSAAAAGAIPKSLPSDDAVRMIIQAVVSSMKLGGILGDPPPAPAVPSQQQTITLKPGQSLVILGGTS